MTGNPKSPPPDKAQNIRSAKQDSNAEGGLFSRWSARKVAVAQGEAETANAQTTVQTEDAERQETEARQLANRRAAEAIDIDTADYDTDFTPFLLDGVPEALRRRALKALWRTNPALANVDGLNDYDEDFRAVSGTFTAIKSSWEVGRGYAGKAEDVTRQMQARDEEVRKAQAAEAEETGDTESAGDDTGQDEVEAKSVVEAEEASGSTDIIDEIEPPPASAVPAGDPDLAGVTPAENIAVSARVSLRHRLLADEN
ncbi:hypothetical protein MNBD_ALPHA09-1473 [hydrothermal vent metagenome]|uniref:DUF3306 domain-containing protein n=1 Tax=hydrothermal vent metagenome TaxID=652676 RepID=A0A3B0T724_9ZZZZ